MIIKVVSDTPLGFEIVKGAIPTPRLMEVGRGRAYFVKAPDDSVIPGVWYLHEPGRYESPDGEYRRVKVIAAEEG